MSWLSRTFSRRLSSLLRSMSRKSVPPPPCRSAGRVNASQGSYSQGPLLASCESQACRVTRARIVLLMASISEMNSRISLSEMEPLVSTATTRLIWALRKLG